MLDQLREGVHVNPRGYRPNPSLVVWGNPPHGSRVISHRVYAVSYKHLDDGQDYEHEFAPGVNLFTHAKDHSVSLYRPDGKPLWKDF